MTIAIHIDPAPLLHVLDERGWTKGEYSDAKDDAPVCLHGRGPGMTADLFIYGASDDVVVLKHGSAVDEYDGDEVVICLRERGTGAGCFVTMTYTDNGLWSGKVEQFTVGVDGGSLIPWEITIGHDPQRNYTTRVTVHEFDGTIDVTA